MKVAVLHEQLAADARADESDVLDQVAAVLAALQQLGHESSVVTMTRDLECAAAALARAAPDVVFNLVESLDGDGARLDLAPELLDELGIAYTGSGLSATRAAASKLTSKQLLVAHRLPTPVCWSAEQLAAMPHVPAGRYILKSIWEHGSLGLDDDCVVHADRPEHLLAELKSRVQRLGGAAFAEAYVHGREFNLALLADGAGAVQHLPAAEIRFAGARSAPVQIVGYRAKWSPGSAEDEGTPRSFALAAVDAPLVARMQELAAATWRAFGLRGYARIDFRVDAAGAPWIIDVNTNPCLSPDAGFAAAVQAAGLPFARAIERILAATS